MVYKWVVILLSFSMLVGCGKVLKTDIQESVSPSEAKEQVMKEHRKDNVQSIITNIEVVDNEYIIHWKDTDPKSKRQSGSDRVTKDGVERVNEIIIRD